MDNLKRRSFLKSFGGGVAGTFALDKLSGHRTEDVRTETQESSKIIGNPNNVKLNIKLVYSGLVHSGSWEGPCRQSAGESGEAERASLMKDYDRWVKYITAHITPGATLLKPEYVEYLYVSEVFNRNETEFEKLEPDKEAVDLYLISTGNCAQVLASEIGKRFNKPIAMVTTGHIGLDAGAHLRNRGYEAHIILDDDEVDFKFEELNNLINLLRARKMFRQLSMLIITNTTLPSVSSMCGVYNFDDLVRRYGIRTKIIPYTTLVEEMERIIRNEDYQKKADAMADALIKNALTTFIDRKYVVSNSLFYYAVKNLLSRYGCDAFSIDCWEFCASRLPEKWKIVPCMVHTLLNDEGYTSACHNLLNDLLALRIMTALGNRSAFIGGLSLNEKAGAVTIGHNTPGLKMDGYDNSDLPYYLGHFCDSGWGAKISIDFAGDFAKKYDNIVTLVNIDAQAKRIIAAAGRLERSSGYDQYGCALRGNIRLNGLSPREYMNMQADFGQHNVMIYGNYTKDLKSLSTLIGMETIVVTT